MAGKAIKYELLVRAGRVGFSGRELGVETADWGRRRDVAFPVAGRPLKCRLPGPWYLPAGGWSWVGLSLTGCPSGEGSRRCRHLVTENPTHRLVMSVVVVSPCLAQ